MTHSGTTESANPVQSESKDIIFKQEQPWDTPSSPKSSWQAVGEPDAPTWALSGTQSTSAFWEISRHHCLTKKRVCNYVHPKQHSPFPDRQKLVYLDEEILSGYEEDVSFKRDGFTAWVKAGFETILEWHAVDIRKAHADFRKKALYILSGVSHRQQRAQPFTCTEKAQHLQLEPRTWTWKRRRYREANRRAVLFNKDTVFPDIGAGQGVRRRTGLGDTRYHIACFFSTTTAQRPRILHSDVSPHQQQFCPPKKKRGIGRKLILTIRAVMLEERGRGCWRYQRGCLATRHQR